MAFSSTQIDCAAYTLRVGREVFVSPSTAVEAARQTRVLLEKGQDFVIPPGQLALVLTEESVTVPTSAVAFISMKARIKFKGLVNVSGFHVDPGYSGHLIFGVYNASSSPVHLAQGDDAFLMWYASLDLDSKVYSRRDAAYGSIPSEFVNQISGPLESLRGLSDRIASVERKQEAISVGVAFAVGLFLTVLAVVIPLVIQSCTRAGALPEASATTGEAAQTVTKRVVG